jgi:RND family efflux transporter MFP subunit
MARNSLKYVSWAALALLAVFVAQRVFFPAPPKTDVVTLVEAPATQLLAVVGRAVPRQTVDIRPEAQGRISQFLVDEGSVVSVGQVLAYVDAGEQVAALERANADVAAKAAEALARSGDVSGRQGDVARQMGEMSARQGDIAQRQSDLAARRADLARFQADLASKRANADVAQRDFDRTETLAGRGYASAAALDAARANLATARAGVQTTQSAISSAQAGIEAALAAVRSAQGGAAAAQGAIEAARASVTSADATARSARAAVSGAQAGMREARTRAARFDIRAPMAGIILTRPLDPGQFVDSATILFRIGSGGAPEIETEIDESDADRLKVGTQAILSPTGSNLKIEARITEISPEVDPSTGGRIVRLVPAGRFDAFPPGRTIDVNIIIAKLDKALLVPKSALIEESTVLRVDRSGRVSRTAVTTLDWPGEEVAIKTGIKAGDQIVMEPLKLKGKTRINPVKTAP